MAQGKKLFPAQENSEKVINIIRKHWFAYVIFWLLSTFMIIPLIVAIIYWFNYQATLNEIWGNLLILFGSAYCLFIMGLLIYGFTDFYLDVYIITDRRIVDITQNGFFKRTISELNLRQIQDVNAEVNGLMSTLLHFGNVHIQTAGEQPNFIFESIPHPYQTSKKILDLHEAYLKKQEEETETEIEEEFKTVVHHQSALEKKVCETDDNDKLYSTDFDEKKN